MKTGLLNPTDYVTVADPEQYEYFGGRLKKKRQLKKQLREEGMSRKHARKTAKKTLKSGIQAITVTSKQPVNSGVEDGYGEELEGESGIDPLMSLQGLEGEGEEGGSVDYANYLIYGGIGIAVLGVVGILLFSGGKTAAPQAA